MIQPDLFASPKAHLGHVSECAPLPFSTRSADALARLRERAADHGARTLSEVEALALMLARTKPIEACEAAEALLVRFGSLPQALGAPLHDLRVMVGQETAADLKLQHDLACRLAQFPFKKRCVISSWSALTAYLRVAMAAHPREVVRVLYLDKRNQLIVDEVMGEGTIDFAPVFPREIARRALETSAAACIIAHQHPSSDPTPSTADVSITKQIIEALKPLGISLHDHVVVGGDATVSMKALGLI